MAMPAPDNRLHIIRGETKAACPLMEQAAVVCAFYVVLIALQVSWIDGTDNAMLRILDEVDDVLNL